MTDGQIASTLRFELEVVASDGTTPYPVNTADTAKKILLLDREGNSHILDATIVAGTTHKVEKKVAKTEITIEGVHQMQGYFEWSSGDVYFTEKVKVDLEDNLPTT